MEKQLKEKKIRWNISKAMSCVYEVLKESKLKIKATQQYKTAMDRLTKLYGLTQLQVWVLCLTCEYFVEHDVCSTLRNLAEIVDVPVMTIVGWKKEVENLIEKGFLEWNIENDDFQPVKDFCESLYNNTSYIPQPKHEIDDVDFLNYIANLYSSRKRYGWTARAIQIALWRYESEHLNLEMVQRVITEISDCNNRFFLYDVANAALNSFNSNLNKAIRDLYEGVDCYRVASEMLEEKHDLFTKGFIEFTEKGNLSDALVSLSDKGKMLVLGEKAFLFEDTINDKNLIKTDSIKEKKLFYSPENQKEIDRLKAALQEEKLKGIQQRLKDDGLPVGVAVLLYGALGTGKTESVMQIAKETGRSIVHVDISEAKSAWFGESEKSIKKIFTSYKNACEIEEKKGELMPILLFNEADALISKRKSDTSGNCAQTENAIQNIILEELESLKGIFIATTNLASNMDFRF